MSEATPSSRQVFGHWSIDDATATLVRKDGRSLRFVGFAEDNKALKIVNQFDRRWMRFEARLGDLSYALLVERRDVAQSGERQLIWRIDHVRSAWLNGIYEPDYAQWREIDLLACDALITWPNIEPTGLRPVFVASGGGVTDGR